MVGTTINERIRHRNFPDRVFVRTDLSWVRRLDSYYSRHPSKFTDLKIRLKEILDATKGNFKGSYVLEEAGCQKPWNKTNETYVYISEQVNYWYKRGYVGLADLTNF